MDEEMTPLHGGETAAGTVSAQGQAESGSSDAGAAAVSQGEKQAEKHHKGFSSKLGFVLAAAGSAVGLGNLWRFPYLAAKYGGGIFLLCYVLLAATFGFCLLLLEIAIGRKTGKDAIGAFASLNKKFKWFGFLCIAVPVIIVPYYCVIGGWVVKYVTAFVTGDGMLLGENATVATSQEFFVNFTADPWQPLLFFFIFIVATIAVVMGGVQKGIERISKILMPILAVLAVFLMIYVVCQDGAGQGVADLFIPDFSEFKFETLLAALGQLFYSLSLAMAIMITYGSYMKKDASIPKAGLQIAVCDSTFAIMAATIIIPSIYAFSPNPSEAISASGPSLMFVQLPAVFNNLPGGRWIGLLFFVLVFFAALTSSISLVETIVAVLRQNLHLKRWAACLIVLGFAVVVGTFASLGFGVLDWVKIGDKNLLDIFDYVSNSILMPIVAIGTCIIAGYFVEEKFLMDEIGFKKKGMRKYFRIMVRYVAPLCMAAILISGLFLKL